MSADELDIDRIKRKIEERAAAMKADLLAEKPAAGPDLQIAGASRRSALGRLLEMIGGCDALKSQHRLSQVEFPLRTASENCQIPGPPPPMRHRPRLVRVLGHRAVRAVALLSRFITRQQSIYNANTNLALHQLVELQRLHLARLADLEKRLTILELDSRSAMERAAA